MSASTVCQGTTQHGERCKRAASAGSHYCHQHAKSGADSRLESTSRPRASAARETAPPPNPSVPDFLRFAQAAAQAAGVRPNGAAAAPSGTAATADWLGVIAQAVAAAASSGQPEAHATGPNQGSDQSHASDRAQSAPQGPINQTIYSAAYYLAFGAAFPAYLALGFLPPNSALVRGLRDGTEAAKESARRWTG